MAAAETARLIASLELQDKNFTRGLRNVERGVGRVDKKLSAFGGFVNRNLARGIDSFAASLVGGVFAGRRVAEGTRAAAGADGGRHQVNRAGCRHQRQEITNLAEKYEGLNAIIGDEVIRGGENMLLTFTNINKQAFEPALAAILDHEHRDGQRAGRPDVHRYPGGQGTQRSDQGPDGTPRVGVSFTKEQVKKIKSLQKEGKLYEAQQIILDELNKEFGGSFAAQGDTTAGKVAKFHDAVEDLQRTFAKALLPIIVKVADKLGSFLSDPAVVRGIEKAGEALGSAFDGMLAAAEKINWKAIGNGLRIAADFAGQLVGWFGKMPDWAQALLVGGVVATKLPIVGDIFSEAAKGLIKGVLGINAGIVNVNGPVAGGGGAGGAGGGKGRVPRRLQGVSPEPQERHRCSAESPSSALRCVVAEVRGLRQIQGWLKEEQGKLDELIEGTSGQNFQQTLDNLTSTVKGSGDAEPIREVAVAHHVWSGSSPRTSRWRPTVCGPCSSRANSTGRRWSRHSMRSRKRRALHARVRRDLPRDRRTQARSHRRHRSPRQAAAGTGCLGAPWSKPLVTSDNLVKQINALETAQQARGRISKTERDTSRTTDQTRLQHQGITTQTSAQTAELGNIKNASATLNTTTYAGLLAATTATTAGNLLSIFQSASQVTRRGRHHDGGQQHHDGGAGRRTDHGQCDGESPPTGSSAQSTRSTCPST